MNTRSRVLSLAAEPLEERLALSAVPFVSADVPFSSAAEMLEADTTFTAIPVLAATASSGEYYVGTFFDVNKHGGSTDSKLCWAAATANVLAYTNWGYSTASSGETPDDWLFASEQEIYDYYAGNFTNVGGHLFYSFPWFADGSYTVQGQSGWAQVIGDGGGLYPGISIPDVRPYLHYTDRGEAVVADMTEYLKEGYGVVLAIGWYRTTSPTSRSGGHSVSVWGYTFDDSLDPSDPNYYTGLIVTNSDDSYTGTKTFSIQWYEEYGMYRITNYSGGRGWIEDFTCLKPVETLTGVSAAGYSGSCDGQPHCVTVSGIDWESGDEYTVIYNYDGTFSLTSPEYTEPGEYQVVVVAVKNEFDAIWSAPVEILIQGGTAGQLDAPEHLSAASAGLNRHNVSWTAVAGAAGYELAYSADGGQSWISAETAETNLLVGGLSYGKTLLYRVRALPDSSGFLTSEWSDTVRLTVCPMDIEGDGFIGPGDLSLLSVFWFTDDGDENWDPRCDIDGDGFIGPGDFTYLSANWFCDTDNDGLTYPS